MFEDIIMGSKRVEKAGPQIADSSNFALSGDNADVREFPMETEDLYAPGRKVEPAVQSDEQDFDSVSQRLGRFATDESNRYARRDVSVPGTTVAGPDPFLHGDSPRSAYVGGEEVKGGPNKYSPALSATPGNYMAGWPDGDAREAENFEGDGVETPIAGPANTTASLGVRPGRVGAVRKSLRKGTFTGWLRGVTSERAGFEG